MYKRALLALPAVLLACVPAHAQPGAKTGGIRGKIVVPAVGWGERIELLIERQGEVGQVFAVTYTDSLGSYYVDGLPLGSYVLVVKLDGYNEVRERVDLGNPEYGANVPTINIILDRKPPDSEENPSRRNDPNVVDASELRKSYPKKAVEEYEKAQEDARKGSTARALERLRTAVKLAPDFYPARHLLGVVFEQMKRPAEAENEYRLARELNPRFAPPRVSLGRLYLEQAEAREKSETSEKLLQQAIEVLEEAVKLQGSATAHYLLGAAYYKTRRDADAEANLKRSLDLNDGAGPARLVLANVYIRQEQWSAALEHLNAYLKANPNSPDRRQIEEIRDRIMTIQ